MSAIHSTRPPRHGFTLVELLVVISIIGVLMGLLLPAVQMARESGRRTQCANNLKQIGLAFVQHDSQFKTFPDGGVGPWPAYPRLPLPPMSPTPRSSNFNTAPKQNWGWGYQILPFMEQEALWSNVTDEVVAAMPLGGYFCPTRRRPVAFTYNAASNPPDIRAMIDYAGNAGCGAVPPSSNEPGSLGTGHAQQTINGVQMQLGGTVVQSGRGMPVSLVDNRVPDGASNTILVAEKYVFEDTEDIQPPGVRPPNDDNGFVSGWDWDIVRWGPTYDATASAWFMVPQPDSATPAVGSEWQYYGAFGASHPGVFNAVFADGNVRSIRLTIDPAVLSAVCTRRNGKNEAQTNPDAL